MKPIGANQVDISVKALLSKGTVLASLGGAVYFLGAFVYVAISRMGYPFALEWLEGGSYAQVHRVLTGLPLYARPSMEYVAMIYPPLYYYAGAVIARAVGFGFLPLRLISFAASLGALALIFLIVKGRGGNTLAAALGSGLFAATYHLSGTWYDIARVDMLAVFLVLLAIWLLRLRGWWWHVSAGIVFALACLTKQIHLISLACLIVYLGLFERRKLLTFMLPCVAALSVIFLGLDGQYEGWIGFFVLKLALGSGEYVTFEPGMFLDSAMEFWLNSILLALPIVALSILVFIIAGLREARDRAGLYFYLACAAGMVGTSWAVVQVGGYRNDLVPAYAAVALLFGIALQCLVSMLPRGSLRGSALLAACALQFALLWYPIGPQLPSDEDLTAGRSLVAQVRAQSGDVYVPFHPELALMGGKKPFASWSPMFQLEGNYGGGDIRATGRVKTEFARAMQRRQFTMIILDQESNWIWGDPEKYYTRGERPVFADEDVFWPVTGWQTRPEFLLLPPAD